MQQGIFTRLYQYTMALAKKPGAVWFLSVISFAESSFFPIPPDVLLAPMSLARPKKAWWYAALTTIFSVLGGLAGYFIGMYAFDILQPYLQQSSYWPAFVQAQAWFASWGFWAIFIAGFSPIPYKAFTIAAGVVSMNLFTFALASLIGRGMRFFLVAGLMAWGGEKMEKQLLKYVDRLGWATVILIILFVLYKQFIN